MGATFFAHTVRLPPPEQYLAYSAEVGIAIPPRKDEKRVVACLSGGKGGACLGEEEISAWCVDAPLKS